MADYCSRTGKVKHETRQSAQTALTRTERANYFKKRREEPLHVYRCPFCHSWHTGRTTIAKTPYRRHDKHRAE